MKKILNIIFTATALLAFASIACAQYGPYSYMTVIQDPDEDDLLEPEEELLTFPKDNGLQTAKDFAYSKNVSAPFSNGTYWIKLESYATGSASRIEGAAPADIVLVLDLSSSMTGSRTVIDGYNEATTPNGGWTPNNINSGTYYILYEGEYYRVRRGGNNNNRFVYFDLENSTRCYLVNNAVQVGGAQPSIGNNTVVYRGTLYTVSSHTETRLDALKRATKAFIKQIDKNDKYEDTAGTIERENGRLGNRISIITFNSSATTRNTLEEGIFKDAEGGAQSTADALCALVDGFTTQTGTTPYNGFVAANAQLATIPEARMEAASRTVVFFTDGEPYDQDNGYGTGYRWKAVGEALKTKTKDNPETEAVEGYDATVFSVGLFSSSPTYGGDTWRYLNYISSNAPNATTYNDHGEPWDENAGYYYDASDESVDLAKVFTEIASQSGGTTSSLSAASSNVDVVSNSFILPFEVTATNVQQEIKIFIAKVDDAKTKAANGVLDFNEGYDYQKGYLPDDWTYQELNADGSIKEGVAPKKADATIKILPQGTNGIKVQGFDYSSCFCGPIYAEGWNPEDHTPEENLEHVDHYQGYKIIIMIPIKMNPDAVGGPSCDTNAPGSGIYASDGETTAYVSYKSPTVSLPYNIHIKKTGLKPGESAKFSISRAKIPTSGTWTPEGLTYTYVTSVFVTQPMGDTTSEPVVKVRGLPSIDDDDDDETTDGAFIYKVSEENWAWSYHRDVPQYTDKSKVDNPFTFNDSQKEDIDVKVRHAESKVNNIFNGSTSTTRVYIDSKTNESSDESKRY